jgi:hypothetical protein
MQPGMHALLGAYACDMLHDLACHMTMIQADAMTCRSWNDVHTPTYSSTACDMGNVLYSMYA